MNTNEIDILSHCVKRMGLLSKDEKKYVADSLYNCLLAIGVDIPRDKFLSQCLSLGKTTKIKQKKEEIDWKVKPKHILQRKETKKIDKEVP